MAPSLVVAGYLSLDRIFCPGGVFDEVPGGAALYAALAGAAAGAEVHLCAKVAADFPSWALDGLARAGVRLDKVERVAGRSRRAELVEPDAAPERFSIRRSPTHRKGSWWERTEALVPSPLAVAADGYVVMPMPGDAALAHARQGRALGALVVADTSEAYARAAPADVLSLSSRVHVFAPSRSEVRLLFPGLDEELAQAELARRAGVVVQKRGHEGYWLSTPATPLLRVDSVARDVVDTTGAGDASVGALAAALVQGLDPEAAVGIAAEVAAGALRDVGPAGLGLAMPAAVGG